MGSKGKKDSKLILRYLGEDDWSRPVYQDQFKRLWKDVELGDSAQPSLYAPVGNCCRSPKLRNLDKTIEKIEARF